MKASLLPLLSTLPAAVSAWTPSLPPPPPAIVRLKEARASDQLTNVQHGRLMDLSSASKVSSARIASQFKENGLSTIVPLPRARHALAQKVLNLSPLFSVDGPQPEDVVQGESGDCYLLALLAAMAKHQPDDLRQAIIPADGSDNAYFIGYNSPVDNTPNVALVFDTSYVDLNNQPIYAGDKAEAVASGDTASETHAAAVSNPGTVTIENGAAVMGQDRASLRAALSDKKVSWVKVFENWFANMNEQYSLLNSKAGFEGISQGGWAAIPYKLLTGKNMEIVAPENLAHFKGLLNQAEDGKIVILISNSKTFSEYYFPGTHAYAVLGHEDGQADIYNPHGRRFNLDDKVLFDNTVRVLVEQGDAK